MKRNVIAVLVGLALSSSAMQAAAQDTPPPKLAGDFMLRTTAGDSLQLSSLRGRVVLLNLWATWCAPCLQEMPDLNELHESLGEEGLTVVGLAVDDEEDWPVVDRYAKRLGIIYPVVYGSMEAAQSVLGTGAYPILPTTLVIARDGSLVNRIVGTVPLEETTRSLKAMLRR